MPPEISPVAVLAEIARFKAVAAKGSYDAAQAWRAARQLPAQMERQVRAAIGASGSGDGAIASDGTVISIGQWSDVSRTTSCFFRIKSDNAFVNVPPNTRVGLVTGAASGAKVDEGKSIPLSKVTLANISLQPEKCAALVAVTDTLLFDLSASGMAMLNRELLGAISSSVDGAFLAAITAGLTPITSTAPLADLRAAQLAVNSVGRARLYFCASPDVGKLASTVSTASGGHAFQGASAAGGELAQLPFLIATGLSAGTLALIDASGVAAWGAAPTVDVSQAAALEMSSTPVGDSGMPAPASLVSMFQTNCTAMRAVCEIAAVRLHANAVSLITGISASTWGT